MLSTIGMVVWSVGSIFLLGAIAFAPWSGAAACLAIQVVVGPLVTANMLRHFLAQPMLRLTPHEVLVTRRWLGWRRAIRFPLTDLTIEHLFERGPDDATWAVIVLSSSEHTVRVPLRRSEGTDQDQARADLAWVVATIEAARQKRTTSDDGSRETLEAALNPLRRPATEERPASPHGS